jgi:predicted Mrr-cat superfamily restriction endonuclease
MSSLIYPEMIGRLSQNVKVIWYNKELPKVDLWDELRKHIIKLGSSINIEEMLDRKGEEDAEAYF